MDGSMTPQAVALNSARSSRCDLWMLSSMLDRAQKAQSYLLSRGTTPELQPQFIPEMYRGKNKDHRCLNSLTGSGGEQNRSSGKDDRRRPNSKTC